LAKRTRFSHLSNSVREIFGEVNTRSVSVLSRRLIQDS
jgi:hypothetical protein